MVYFVTHDRFHTDIYMTRGDTLKAKALMMLSDKSEYIPQTGDTMRFVMKRRYTDTELLIEKSIPITTQILALDPADTSSLRFGEYVYDIEITYANGDVDTFLQGMFTLTEEVD